MLTILPKLRYAASISLVALFFTATGLHGSENSDPSPTKLADKIGPAGILRMIGTYTNADCFIKNCYEPNAYSIAKSVDGKILVYGTRAPLVDGADQKTLLKDRLSSAGSAMDNEPLLWKSQQHGWEKIERPPECSYNRYLHTMTALPNNKILIAGGRCDASKMRDDHTPYLPYTGLSLWNSTTSKWDTTPTLSDARFFHTATLLGDGSVLLAGGQQDQNSNQASIKILASVERYHLGEVEQHQPLRVARAKHTATLLNNHFVMVAGGVDHAGKAIASVEMANPSLVWQDAPPLKVARYGHSATLLDDGRLMIAGGINHDGEPINSVEIWNPARGTWEEGAPLLMPFEKHTATRLANGDVLVIGNSGADSIAGITVDSVPALRAMLWDFAKEQWRPAGFLARNHIGANNFTLFALPNGSAQAFGLTRILQWSPTKETSAGYSPYGVRYAYNASMMADGRIMLSGGYFKNTFLDWAEIYDTTSRRFTITGRMNFARHSHGAIAIGDGRVLVAGGWASSPDKPIRAIANSPEIWDPHTGQWSLIKKIQFEWQDKVHLGKLQDGRILFFASRELAGGAPQSQVEYRAWLWNPRTDSVEVKNVQATPRSDAAIVILPDGRVLRAGGNSRYFVPEVLCPPAPPGKKIISEEDSDEESPCQDEPAHWAEASDHSVEVWDSRTGEVRTLSDQGWYLPNPKTLILKNGNILITNYQNPNPYHHPNPAHILLWDTKAERWQKLPSLPTGFNWPITEMADGRLITKSAALLPGANSWSEVPEPPQIGASLHPLPSGSLLALSLVAPHATVLDEVTKQWQMQLVNDLPPKWLSKPAMVALPDSRLMVIAHVETGRYGVHTAHIWNPASDSWINAGKLSHAYQQNPTKAVLLSSGRVLHIGSTGRKNLICEIWRPGDNQWEACGNFSATGTGAGRNIALGALDNGRAVMVTGSDSAFVFSGKKSEWMPTKINWNTEGLTFGAPIRGIKPLARIFDNEKNDWVGINAIAASYYENSDPMSPSLLWNSAKQLWEYIFIPNKMGRKAQFLPDGCALSPHLTLFNPETAQITPLANPGIGIRPADSNMVVLKDGTVVIAGIQDTTNEAGLGFFYRKASCAGFAAAPEDTNLFNQNPGIKPIFTPNQNILAVTSETSLLDITKKYQWIILAAVGPFLLYFLLSRMIIPVIGRVAIRALPKKDLDTFKLKLPWAFSSIIRVVIYGVVAAIALSILLPFLQFTQAINEEMCAADPAECLDKKTGILKSVPALEKADPKGSALPKVPCQYVGVWSSRGMKNLMFRITLKDDGTYIMDPNQITGSPTGYKGYWAVQGNNMIWRHIDSATQEIDINPIIPESATRFTLVEKNESLTKYELIRPIKSNTCSP